MSLARKGEMTADRPNEFFFEDCGRRCTRSPDGRREYGHRAKREGRNAEGACPRRDTMLASSGQSDYRYDGRDERGRFI